MTDTLRGECEKFALMLAGKGSTCFEEHEQQQYFLDDLVAFARAQQAALIRSIKADMSEGKFIPRDGKFNTQQMFQAIHWLEDYLEAQATARERGV